MSSRRKFYPNRDSGLRPVEKIEKKDDKKIFTAVRQENSAFKSNGFNLTPVEKKNNITEERVNKAASKFFNATPKRTFTTYDNCNGFVEQSNDVADQQGNKVVNNKQYNSDMKPKEMVNNYIVQHEDYFNHNTTGNGTNNGFGGSSIQNMHDFTVRCEDIMEKNNGFNEDQVNNPLITSNKIPAPIDRNYKSNHHEYSIAEYEEYLKVLLKRDVADIKEALRKFL